MNLYDLLEDYFVDGEDSVRTLITWFLNPVMEFEALQQSGADTYERNDSRNVQRNGYRKRSLTTRHRTLELLKPQLREIPFQTQVFERYSRTEKALANAIMESYLQGVSTRKIKHIISQLGIENVSASRVSRITQELDEKVREFISKPIEQGIKYLLVDATYFNIRDSARYTNKALFVVAGVRKDGYMEILGARIADGEDAMFREDLFTDLKKRGLRGVEMIISDGHKGLQRAVTTSFPGSSWQMCHVHLIRAVLKTIPKKHQKEVAEKIKEAMEDPLQLSKVVEYLGERKLNKAIETLARFHFGTHNCQAFPKEHCRKIRTTNILECVNRELKRRSKVIGAFPNEEALLRLSVSILIDINEEWITGNRYLNMED
ncbi:transposase [Methanomethylovorans hollandica DSM 15978]|uniref:Transposase n=1 Tax=Methanomethylovorans hollandica (strain DSM 15978 / NBRC 107637 / DMS1) TaxID=867904 RepID=L0KW81_METHD|nr:IS256 family transposase [Methanomethylovorans hollandica]AGB49386.1 transposase [Methanomethylovorans hollandica DSM 15978]